MNITVEFGGGLEQLFEGQNKIHITLPSDSNIRSLISHLATERLKERPELFVKNDTVRPGILVLVNDTDWELEGGIECRLKNEDNVLFISTLHGG